MTYVLPCPFCGGLNIVPEPHRGQTSCRDCGAEGPDRRNGGDEVGRWNRRNREGQIAAAVKPMVDAEVHTMECKDIPCAKCAQIAVLWQQIVYRARAAIAPYTGAPNANPT